MFKTISTDIVFSNIIKKCDIIYKDYDNGRFHDRRFK